MRRLASFALLAALAAAGCAETPKPETAPDLPKVHDEPEPPRPVIAVRKIVIFPSNELVGYLKVHEDNEPALHKNAVHVFWVYDTYFKVQGFYTERGHTYKVLKDGSFADLGIHEVDDAKRILLKAPGDLKLELVTMDAPRTLESDAEAAKAKQAAAAAPAAPAAAPK